MQRINKKELTIVHEMTYVKSLIIEKLCLENLQYREREDNGLFITLDPKVFFSNIYVFIGLTTLGTLNKFYLVSLFSWVSKCFNN